MPLAVEGREEISGAAGKQTAISATHSMNPHRAIAVVALALGGCNAIVHTPPRTSVELALAKKPELVRLASTPETSGSVKPEPRFTTRRSAYVPPVEPELPTNDRIEAVAEIFTRGKEALEAGKNDEAIKAFQEATNLDPQFSDGWVYLGVAYDSAGQSEKAKAAYQRAKSP